MENEYGSKRKSPVGHIDWVVNMSLALDIGWGQSIIRLQGYPPSTHQGWLSHCGCLGRFTPPTPRSINDWFRPDA
jgi:hypothetical protein